MLQTMTKTVKRFWLPFVLCAGLLGTLSMNAFAASNAQLRPDLTVIIDGAEQTFYNAQGQEVHPILCDGTTYLPVRAIGEVMGKNVDWNQSTKTVTLSGTRTAATAAGTPDAAAKVTDISVDIRSDFTIAIDGTAQTFQDASGNRVFPILYNGSTYLPLRAVGELMGKNVDWDGSSKTVTMSGPSGESLVTDADSFSGVPAGTTAVSPETGSITREKAREIALAKVPGASVQNVTKLKTDREDGRLIYEVEIKYNGMEYDFEIDAADGTILDMDSEIDD